jgi:transcriptional regulator with GAF, ATPase, and Fis domain
LNCAAHRTQWSSRRSATRRSFTGATSARSGYFEDAKDSTLFLDEIGELPLELQAKLLRVLENGEYQRVGETQSRVSNARVVAATNRDMRQEIRAGRFRADLYHRLSVFTINVPPLRELGEDRRVLLDHFREFYARQAHVDPFEFDAGALQSWLDYGFPGNARELRNIVIRLTTKYAGRQVTAVELQPELDLENLDQAAGLDRQISRWCWTPPGVTCSCTRTSASTTRSPNGSAAISRRR